MFIQTCIKNILIEAPWSNKCFFYDEFQVSNKGDISVNILSCTDETCSEIHNNAVLDVSPDSMEDPMTWFKVKQL